MGGRRIGYLERRVVCGCCIGRRRAERSNITVKFLRVNSKITVKFTVVVVVVTRPLPRDEGMAEDHGDPEAGQLPRVWTRGHRETESRQRVSGAKSP